DRIQRAYVVEVIEGAPVKVQLTDSAQVLECQVLHTGSNGLTLFEGDAVLVWRGDQVSGGAVIMGRTGPYTPPPSTAVAPRDFAARPQTLVLEAQGDVVLRNGQAKLTLGADGDVEVVCASYTTRSHRLLRLLAPLIKLN